MAESQDLVCTGCQKTLRIPAKFWGKKVRCPQCSQVLAVPAGAAATAPAAARKSNLSAVAAAAKKSTTTPAKAPPPVPEFDDVEFIDNVDDPYADLPDSYEQDLPPRRKSSAKSKKRKKTHKSNGGAFRMEKGMLGAGVLGGMGLMAGAVVWFVVGLMFGYIFYYPPVMFVIGFIAMIKGFVSRD